jgi:hypothetical protein
VCRWLASLQAQRRNQICRERWLAFANRASTRASHGLRVGPYSSGGTSRACARRRSWDSDDRCDRCDGLTPELGRVHMLFTLERRIARFEDAISRRSRGAAAPRPDRTFATRGSVRHHGRRTSVAQRRGLGTAYASRLRLGLVLTAWPEMEITRSPTRWMRSRRNVHPL